MIENISFSGPNNTYYHDKKEELNYNVHHISPKEMDTLTLNMFNKGEISLRERLAFVPLETTNLSESIGQNVKSQYNSKIWDDKNRKRDMVMELNNILREQLMNNESKMNIKFTKDALALLKRIDQKPSFKDILNQKILSS